MPTYDEIIGHDGIDRSSYNARLLEYARPNQLNVLAIHAEVEGIVCAPLFDEFLSVCRRRDIRLIPLRDLPQLRESLPALPITQGPIPGRDGDVCWQSPVPAH
jgi:undecaprenyl phosphate-alpha-L-ara4FN deformylase